jgi:hypothetical protein
MRSTWLLADLFRVTSRSNLEVPPDVPDGGNPIFFCWFVELRPTDQADAEPATRAGGLGWANFCHPGPSASPSRRSAGSADMAATV